MYYGFHKKGKKVQNILTNNDFNEARTWLVTTEYRLGNMRHEQMLKCPNVSQNKDLGGSKGADKCCNLYYTTTPHRTPAPAM